MADNHWHRQSVLITGGRRLGRLLALDLADRGAAVALTYHTSRELVEQTVAECRAKSGRAIAVAADLREPQACRDVVKTVTTAFGQLDALVNLTSIYTPTPWSKLTDDDYHQAMASNLTAPYFMAVAAAKQMQQQPLREAIQGRILHFTDWAVERPYRRFLPYLVAKGGLVTLTKALAVELAPTILVNAIAPGTVLPPPDLSETDRQRVAASAALNRLGTPDDVLRLTMYLLSETTFVTGEVFRVDGGRFLGPPEQALADAPDAD
jgi:pteridine reductase